MSLIHICPLRSRCMSRCVSVRLCPERTLPPHMRAFNKAAAAVFNGPSDDNCGLRDGLVVKATAVRAYFSVVTAAR